MRRAAHLYRLALLVAIFAGVGAGCAREPKQAGASAHLSERPLAPREIVLGTSVKGQPIALYVFGDGPDVTFVFAAIHGDETSAAYVGGRLLEELQSTSIREGRTVALLPVANPDGVAAGTRTNANGVDCNRNFPASNWRRRVTARVSNGSAPASEPETRAVMEAFERLRPARIISIHCGLRCNNFDGPAEGLARVLASYHGYPVQASVGYATPGSFGSWAGVDRGIPVVTLELPRGCKHEEAWNENRAGLLAVILDQLSDANAAAP